MVLLVCTDVLNMVWLVRADRNIYCVRFACVVYVLGN